MYYVGETFASVFFTLTKYTYLSLISLKKVKISLVLFQNFLFKTSSEKKSAH